LSAGAALADHGPPISNDPEYLSKYESLHVQRGWFPGNPPTSAMARSASPSTDHHSHLRPAAPRLNPAPCFNSHDGTRRQPC
jgi:hypothetical protein